MSSTTSVPRTTAATRIRSGGTGKRNLLAWVRNAIFVVAGVVGLIAFALVLLPLVGYNTVVLASGSMSPTWPAGSLLVSRDAAANEIAVGDIVTVPRPGELPVTHRVVAVEGDGQLLTTRVLTLQGDGNSSVDPEPYSVDRVGLVLGGVPWGGQLVVALRSPFAIAGVTLVVAALVLSAWWPTTGGRRHEKAH